jgi:pimeloyl-ACP methyl ester carboxylesterase
VAGGSYDPVTGFPSGWTPGSTEWSACDLGPRRGECAVLEVPLDWSDPDGPQVELALARVPASGERVGPLLVNPGGPGGSGVDFVGGLAGGPLAERFDLVSWDPRGVGRHTAVSCDGPASEFLALDPEPDDAAEQAGLEAAADAVARACAEDAGELLGHLTTEDTARDLEAIRLALGGEPLSFLGFSYGTHIGQAYAELFGDRVRAMVLDGAVDPAQGFEEFLVGQAAAFDRAFATQHEQCAAAGAGACGVDDLTRAYDEVARAVEDAPLPASPPEVGPREVGPADLAVAAAYTAYLDGGWELLGPALAEALDGSGDGLAELARSYRDLAAYGPYAAVVCTDSPPPAGAPAYRGFAEEAARVSPRFGASIANELLPCATWAAPPRGPAEALTAPEAPAILVVGTTGDPATPLENAESVARALERGHLLVAEADGHGALGIPCVDDLVRAYLVDLALPPEGTRC